MVTGLEDIIKVGARLLDFYYMSNSFISDPSVILDSSAECDNESDIRGPSTLGFDAGFCSRAWSG
jgi:hypothetical protein